MWRGGRTVLAGDAVHPVGPGQGASMAVENAVVLAYALSEAPVPAALARYEQERRTRTAKPIKMAAASRDAETAGRVARASRASSCPSARACSTSGPPHGSTPARSRTAPRGRAQRGRSVSPRAWNCSTGRW
ncbi:FAD-dependent monooxygenase [Actinomadura sp. 21ATH]|uniref:FAD-dependent monooxygenase n=1 Tax=Actinomadura sp. 21ATH TaxID=1735444 RepID=UPI0035BF3A8B